MFNRRFLPNNNNSINLYTIDFTLAVAQSVPISTTTDIVWSAGLYDNTVFNYNNATGALTLLRRGYYLISFTTGFPVVGGGTRRLSNINIADNVTVDNWQVVPASVLGSPFPNNILYRTRLINAVLKCQVYQDVSSPMNLNTPNTFGEVMLLKEY